MKRVKVLFLLSIMSLGLIACSKPAEKTENTPVEQTQEISPEAAEILEKLGIKQADVEKAKSVETEKEKISEEEKAVIEDKVRQLLSERFGADGTPEISPEVLEKLGLPSTNGENKDTESAEIDENTDSAEEATDKEARDTE